MARHRFDGCAAALLLVLASLATFAPAWSQSADARLVEPEAATGRAAKPAVIARHHMIVTANPYATDAGLEILRAGGSAVDAAIAAQMVLALVEPQSSGLGGGAFLISRDAQSGALETIDGRETAPKGARPERFLRPDGSVGAFADLVTSPLSVGVPGVVRALELAHKRHGKLPWARLLERGILLAENGFLVSPRLSALLTAQGAAYFNAEARALYFDPSGAVRPAGTMLANPALAATLRTIASGGADAFYSGALASTMIAALDEAPGHANDMTLDDVAAYEAKVRAPVCQPYRGYRICSMGAPSSGGVTMGMVLAMFEAAKAPVASSAAVPAPSDASRVFADDVSDIALLVEAEKLAYADRDKFIADPAFVPQSADLLDGAYLAARAKLIDPAHPIVKATPGSPPLKGAARLGTDGTVERPGTSHLSILDDDGNAVAMTTSVQTGFGSGIMAGGFLLNSELTDFSFKPADADGAPIANRVEGGKRPRSSMAPTIILDPAGQLFAILGSPGGNRIILYNLKAIVCLIDWHCTPELASGLPNFGSRNGPLEVEAGTQAESRLGAALQGRGAAVTPVEMTSGLGIIELHDGVIEGAADPRREGTVEGD